MVLNQSPTFFLINVPVQRLGGPTFVSVRRLYQPDGCTSPKFVSVRRLYQSDDYSSLTLVPVRRSYQSDDYTSLTLVPVRRLYQSDVRTSPTFVLSDLCSVRRLYWYLLVCDIEFKKYQGPNSMNLSQITELPFVDSNTYL